MGAAAGGTGLLDVAGVEATAGVVCEDDDACATPPDLNEEFAPKQTI
jgi:hypothetical protein